MVLQSTQTYLYYWIKEGKNNARVHIIFQKEHSHIPILCNTRILYLIKIQLSVLEILKDVKITT